MTAEAAVRAAVERDMARLAQLPTKALRAEWQRVFRTPPPQKLGRDLLLRAIAYKLQERAYGSLSQIARRSLRTLAKQLEAKNNAVPIPTSTLRPGVRLLREWNRHVHEVTAVQNGFDYRGACYTSLTQIAKQITGTNWSGPRFLGIAQPAGHRARKATKPKPTGSGATQHTEMTSGVR